MLKPKYPIEKLEIGIVHIGLGRFHRAHQAYYTELALEKSFGPWGICAVSLNTRESVDALRAQNGLYTLKLHGAGKTETRVIGCIRKTLFAGDGLEPILAQIANPQTQIVTLTITEKGYHFGPAIGVLASALNQRFISSRKPLTIISCDNIQGNGSLLQSLIHEYMQKHFAESLPWLREQVSFPNSMVDRIVPASNDNTTIETESFGQWVIEDSFRTPRPAWEEVGVQITNEVKTYEKLKLSMLNGTHSFMAYFGTLKGHQFVSEAIADEEIYNSVQNLLKNELPAFVGSSNVQAYAQSLIERYKNPHLKHKLLQIAMDGSVKIPQRWLPSLKFNLANNLPVDEISTALAAWILFCKKAHKKAWALQDPNADLILPAVASTDDPIAILKKLPQIFSNEVVNSTVLREKLHEKYNILQKRFT